MDRRSPTRFLLRRGADRWSATPDPTDPDTAGSPGYEPAGVQTGGQNPVRPETGARSIRLSWPRASRRSNRDGPGSFLHSHHQPAASAREMRQGQYPSRTSGAVSSSLPEPTPRPASRPRSSRAVKTMAAMTSAMPHSSAGDGIWASITAPTHRRGHREQRQQQRESGPGQANQHDLVEQIRDRTGEHPDTHAQCQDPPIPQRPGVDGGAHPDDQRRADHPGHGEPDRQIVDTVPPGLLRRAATGDRLPDQDVAGPQCSGHQREQHPDRRPGQDWHR